ncbi:c-type cytochrome [Prosthecodimorpha staleyi]|uniref:Cytochrome c n=1 Tax=Prosthecodimorpha staleyi TaxID=2840188 RepID=A0A947GCL1_9HYPH|nr:cytochrome c [Prosthecodimorpha staleyi]MBT9289311.1 cytochrome c [Prosthecodimorpha staleyi]
MRAKAASVAARAIGQDVPLAFVLVRLSAAVGLAAAGLAGFGLAAGGPAWAVDGKSVYADVCQACHQEAGKGAAGVAPPLKSAVVKAAAAKSPDYVPLVVLNGLSGPIESEGLSFQTVMPPQGHLSDQEIAAVTSYVYQTLNGAKGVRVDAKALAVLRAGKAPTAAELRAMRSRP